MRPTDPREFSTPPAPVYTGHEEYETRPRRSRRHQRAGHSRARLAAAGLALASGLWLLALAASQATSATVAVPFLERTISALGDVPALLQLHEQQIRSAAGQARGEGRVTVPGFPAQGVTLPRELAQRGSRDEWRAALLREGAEAAYERGPAVFAPGGAATDGGIFSTSQWVRVVMGLASANTHGIAWRTAWALGLLTLALAAVVLASADGVRRFVAIGLALAGGAMFAAAIGLIGVLIALLLNAGNGSAFVGEVGDLIRTISWAPVHLAARLGIAGIAIAVPAAAVAAWLARHDGDLDDDEESAARGAQA